MAKKKAGAAKRMPPRQKTTPLLIRVDEEVREATRKYCYENRVSYSGFVRGLIIEKLRATSYLGGEAKP